MLAYIQAAQIVCVVYAVTLGAVCVVIAGYRWIVARIARQEAEEAAERERLARSKKFRTLKFARQWEREITAEIEKRKRGA